jgi:hypothetical protein
LVSPSALSLLTTCNPEGAARNRALSLWQASTSAGTSTGVIAGGVLTQFLGWRAIFLINLPLIAVLLLIPRVLPDDTTPASQRLDVRGAALATASSAALIYGLSNWQQQGFGSPGLALAFVAALAWRFGPPGHPLARGLNILTIRDGRVSVVRTLIAPETDA